jgi:hypothetical protein
MRTTGEIWTAGRPPIRLSQADLGPTPQRIGGSIHLTLTNRKLTHNQTMHPWLELLKFRTLRKSKAFKVSAELALGGRNPQRLSHIRSDD